MNDITQDFVMPENQGLEIAPTIKNIGENLCVSCSMCCEGVLHNKLEITKAEQERLGPEAQYMLEDDKLYLRLGCTHIGKNGACQKYECRPSGCATYQCSLLKKVNRDEVAFEDALERVATARKLNAACLDAAHDALKHAYWDDMINTGMRGFLATQVAMKNGVQVDDEKSAAVEAAWIAFSDHVTQHFVYTHAPHLFRLGPVLPGGPFDRSEKTEAQSGASPS